MALLHLFRLFYRTFTTLRFPTFVVFPFLFPVFRLFDRGMQGAYVLLRSLRGVLTGFRGAFPALSFSLVCLLPPRPPPSTFCFFFISCSQRCRCIIEFQRGFQVLMVLVFSSFYLWFSSTTRKGDLSVGGCFFQPRMLSPSFYFDFPPTVAFLSLSAVLLCLFLFLMFAPSGCHGVY